MPAGSSRKATAILPAIRPTAITRLPGLLDAARNGERTIPLDEAREKQRFDTIASIDQDFLAKVAQAGARHHGRRPLDQSKSSVLIVAALTSARRIALSTTSPPTPL